MRPRIRTVKPEMRQDERYARLSYPARELFNGLITMADDEGRFRAPLSAILGHVFPYDEAAPRKLRGWVAELRESGMILFYVAEDTPYGAFRHWKRHQKINRARPSELPPPPDPKVVRDNSVNDHGEGTDDAGKDHGAITNDASPHAQARVPDPIQVLCQQLADHIHRNDSKADPKPESERWMTDMRLLVTDRGGDMDEVRQIIDWCQADSFWRSNILSPGKLRKQFTQLVLKERGVSTLDRKRASRAGADVIPVGDVERAGGLEEWQRRRRLAAGGQATSSESEQ